MAPPLIPLLPLGDPVCVGVDVDDVDEDDSEELALGVEVSVVEELVD